MRRCAPLRPIALGFTRRLTRTPTSLVPLQPWLETALVELASRRLAKRKRPTFR